jgi:WhiB family transcriptional regulator, redox-sensing transcriptional regulator
MARSATQLQPISEAWEWQILGRCRDRSGAQFFHPDDDLGRISRRLREAAAKRLCEGCPVRRECATHALTVGEEYGVWGGYSENDRATLRDVGWRDAVDRERLADVPTLDRRLAWARAKAQEAKDRRDAAANQNRRTASVDVDRRDIAQPRQLESWAGRRRPTDRGEIGDGWEA